MYLNKTVMLTLREKNRLNKKMNKIHEKGKFLLKFTRERENKSDLITLRP